MNKPLKILFKYPSRGRKERFFNSLNSIYDNVRDVESFHICCTLDVDDDEMCNNETIEMLQHYVHSKGSMSIRWGRSESKVHAINRDMPSIDWDIVCVMSDDMMFTFYGFDDIIRESFKETLDLLLHLPDNDAKDALATMYIAGRDYYNRFGYIYHPAYKSLFCDNEVQDVARRLGKYLYVDCPGLIFHANPAYGHLTRDALFDTQQEIGWTEDQQTYNDRKSRNFDL